MALSPLHGHFTPLCRPPTALLLRGGASQMATSAIVLCGCADIRPIHCQVDVLMAFDAASPGNWRCAIFDRSAAVGVIARCPLKRKVHHSRRLPQTPRIAVCARLTTHRSHHACHFNLCAECYVTKSEGGCPCVSSGADLWPLDGEHFEVK